MTRPACSPAAPGAFTAIERATDLRLGGNPIVGGSLLVADRIVHLVAFPARAAARPATRHWGPVPHT